ncbi:MAG: YkgJ family cysteine cluster protein [Candidatus Nanopelagicales bacterium]
MTRPDPGPSLPGGEIDDTGPFGAWLEGVRSALRGDSEADVPCGTCTACCRAGQFVHIGPDEADALARIPGELLFPAPGLPPGHVLLGYDEQGRCPMLAEDGCSIYADRPRTCRSYDCRVLVAAGPRASRDAPAPVAERIRRWRFDVTDDEDRVRFAAVRSAAEFLASADAPDDVAVPTTGLGLALMALAVHEAFLQAGPDMRLVPRTPAAHQVWQLARLTRRPG